MDMKGQYRIPAPRTMVWAALNDVNVLKASIPGCDSIVRLSDTQIEATVTAKIGPVKASFKGAVTLSDIDPPNGYTIRGEGKGGPAGFAKGGAVVRLAEEGTETVLSYEVDASVGGKLAQIGGRLIDSTAKKLADEFFATFSKLVAEKSATENASGVQPSAPAVTETVMTPSEPSATVAPRSPRSIEIWIGVAVVLALIAFLVASFGL